MPDYGKLVLVPTPIGNLEDITLRAIRVLKECDLILAEDTRTSGVLLKHFEIDTPRQSYHQHNEHKVTEALIDKIKAGANIALISDAGSPGISDPGYLLVRACVESGIGVEALPGASAIIPAITASGFPCDRFYFEGFLPQKKGRNKRLEYISKLDQTCVIYESPHRIQKLIDQLIEHCGPDRQVAFCRELTKVHEEIIRGTLSEIKEWYSERKARGEFVVILEAYSE